MGVGRTAGVAAAVAGLVTTSAMAMTPAIGATHSDSARTAPIQVVARGLDGPFGLARFRGGFVVAENAANQVTRIRPNGHQQVLLRAPSPAGVAAGRHRVFTALGGPDETGAPTGGAYPAASVLRTNVRTQRTMVIADLMAYELKNNPDGQAQFDADHKPYDALSNPFSMTKYRHGLLVADGGANDVLRVNPRTGRVSTFFVPPTVKPSEVPACAGAQANPGTIGCDPVPTGVAVRHGSVYVSTLGAEVPGAGRIYKLNGRTGRIQRVWRGLDSPTGVAVTGNRTLYFSQVLEGAPEGDGPPPPGFDPSTVGQITRIARNGRMTVAQVTMPTGLVLRGGRLFSTAWSVAFFFQMQDAGQIVRVRQSAFH